MNKHPYNLRQRKLADDEEVTSGGKNIHTFGASSVDMAEMENMLARIQALRHEISTLRESQGNVNDASRSNLQKVLIPKFNKHNPHLWFTQIERSFALCAITSDKFDLISVRLKDEILLSIEDLITNPPQVDKFGTLKERLIAKFAKTSESKLRRLLQGCENAGK